jgi:hypothetical protein
MLGGGLKSPLYQELREKKGLVYYIHCYQWDITNQSSVVLIETETSKNNIDDVQKIITDVIGNPDKYLVEKIIKDLTYDKIREVYDKYLNVDYFYQSIDSEEFKNKL